MPSATCASACRTRPAELRRKVYILDEAHQITKDAWNALLKSLEEPPDFVIFMFASTEPSGFPPAILSRLQRFDVRRLTVAEIEGKLDRILAADGRDAEPGRASTSSPGSPPAGCATPSRCSTSCCRPRPSASTRRRVRDLLGLADAEVVDGVRRRTSSRGDGAAGVALLDGLEERGRDVRALLDQAVDAIRGRAHRGPRRPGRARHDPAALAAAGRRLAAIDPNRAGIGGLRFQLELAMFAGRAAVADAAAARRDRRRPERPRPHATPARRPSPPQPADDRRAAAPLDRPAAARRRQRHASDRPAADHRRRPRPRSRAPAAADEPPARHRRARPGAAPATARPTARRRPHRRAVATPPPSPPPHADGCRTSTQLLAAWPADRRAAQRAARRPSRSSSRAGRSRSTARS